MIFGRLNSLLKKSPSFDPESLEPLFESLLAIRSGNLPLLSNSELLILQSLLKKYLSIYQNRRNWGQISTSKEYKPYFQWITNNLEDLKNNKYELKFIQICQSSSQFKHLCSIVYKVINSSLEQSYYYFKIFETLVKNVLRVNSLSQYQQIVEQENQSEILINYPQKIKKSSKNSLLYSTMNLISFTNKKSEKFNFLFQSIKRNRHSSTGIFHSLDGNHIPKDKITQQILPHLIDQGIDYDRELFEREGRVSFSDFDLENLTRDTQFITKIAVVKNYGQRSGSLYFKVKNNDKKNYEENKNQKFGSDSFRMHGSQQYSLITYKNHIQPWMNGLKHYQLDRYSYVIHNQTHIWAYSMFVFLGNHNNLRSFNAFFNKKSIGFASFKVLFELLNKLDHESMTSYFLKLFWLAYMTFFDDFEKFLESEKRFKKIEVMMVPGKVIKVALPNRQNIRLPELEIYSLGLDGFSKNYSIKEITALNDFRWLNDRLKLTEKIRSSTYTDNQYRLLSFI